MKLIIAKIEINFWQTILSLKSSNSFFLNNIDAIFYKYVEFIWFFIGIAADIVIINNSISNSLDNHLALINIETNAVIDFNLNNSSSNKESYFFDNCIFSFNHDYHKDNLNIGSNDKFDISLIILIKKRIWQK